MGSARKMLIDIGVALRAAFGSYKLSSGNPGGEQHCSLHGHAGDETTGGQKRRASDHQEFASSGGLKEIDQPSHKEPLFLGMVLLQANRIRKTGKGAGCEEMPDINASRGAKM